MRELLTKAIDAIDYLMPRLGVQWMGTTKNDDIRATHAELTLMRDCLPEVPEPAPTFLEELQHVVNRHSRENESDTPDFILAEFIDKSLCAYEFSVRARERWYGRPVGDGRSITVSEREDVGAVSVTRTIIINEAAHGHED